MPHEIVRDHRRHRHGQIRRRANPESTRCPAGRYRRVGAERGRAHGQPALAPKFRRAFGTMRSFLPKERLPVATRSHALYFPIPLPGKNSKASPIRAFATCGRNKLRPGARKRGSRRLAWSSRCCLKPTRKGNSTLPFALLARRRRSRSDCLSAVGRLNKLLNASRRNFQSKRKLRGRTSWCGTKGVWRFSRGSWNGSSISIGRRCRRNPSRPANSPRKNNGHCSRRN